LLYSTLPSASCRSDQALSGASQRSGAIVADRRRVGSPPREFDGFEPSGRSAEPGQALQDLGLA